MEQDDNDTQGGKRRRKKVPDGSNVPKELLDQLLTGMGGQAALADPASLLRDLSAALVSRALESELDHHLGYPPGEEPPEGQTNRRNGHGRKRLRTGQGELDIRTPRDREGSFEPQLVPKHQRRFDGFDDKVLALYARGMSVRDIRAHLEELYGVEVSPDLISRVTDGVLDELRAWQSRPLEQVYCVVYLDVLVVKIRNKGTVQNRSVYLAVGVPMDGQREVLGMWVQENEGAKFWCAILEKLRRRGVEDILVLCADGLTGMGQAVEAIFPRAIFQTCIVHVIRSSTRFVPWKDRKRVCADLRLIYTASDASAAKEALDAFEAQWHHKYPTVARSWRERWDDIIPFLAYPAEMRRVIYTTNTIEALNRNLRKALETRGQMPSDEAALKLLYLSMRHDPKTKTRAARGWTAALNQFAIYFEGRLPA